MRGLDLDRIAQLNALYEEGGPDPSFAQVLAAVAVDDEESLAELIEADGRSRIRLGRPLTLARYLEALPDLAARPDPLDAAIDMALRWLVRDGAHERQAAEMLAQGHPALAEAIRESTTLSQALWSTTRLRAGVAVQASPRALPGDFGPLMPGGRHRYELRTFLGEGAFGQVYLAVDRQLSEASHLAWVAIKVLTSRVRDPWSRQRLIDEATKARRIDHPNAVRVLDRGESGEGEDFIVYEYVNGGDLGRWVRRRRRPLSVEEAIGLVSRIARGVHAAHMAGLVHCDLKPANVLLTESGEAKVADFGIAIRAAEEAAGTGPDGGDGPDERPLGNLAFISPEQYRMEPGALTAPSDLYALGGILYWLLTGRLPNGSSAAEIERVHDAVNGRRSPPLLRDVRPDSDRDAEAICRRAMAVSPKDRYASAAEFADDLDSWLRHEPIRWTRPSITRRAGLWARRKPALAAAMIVIVALLVGGAVSGQWLWLKAARAEIERARREQLAALAGEWVGHLKRARDAGITHELLPQIWLSEWLYGPSTLGQDVKAAELWSVRNQTIRALVDKGRAAGRGDDVQILMWESALGFWLLRDGEIDEAAQILERNLERWTALLRPEDLWLLDLRAVRECARVARAARSGGAGNRIEQWPQAIAGAPALLAAADESLAARARATPIHRMVVEHRAILAGPGFLDDPRSQGELREKLASLVK